MKIISKAEFDGIPDKHKGVYRDGRGDRPEWAGRRMAILNGDGSPVFLEGLNFLVEDDYEHLPWLNKANAMVGACYRMPGGYIEVTRVYRLSEAEALEKDLYHLDRVEYIQHAKWGTVEGGCALAGSDIRKG